jgi:FimV-like protein
MAIASASLLHSSIAAALGLGEITLHSAMGQPLNADIELIEANGLSPEDIMVSLASAEAFSKAGVERVFFLSDLRFTPIIRGNRGVVHIESRKAVTEPYLNFLVRLVRPNGDQLHEYTVLLDPPDSPAGLAATRSRTTTLAGSASKTPESRMPVAPPAAVQGKHYTVVAGDSLASIAKRVQAPGSKASSAELATGIQALNPQAFAGGERSRLKVGQSLLLPDAARAPVQAIPAAAVAPVLPATASAPAPDNSVPQVAEQLTATVLENQQLSKSVDDLKNQVQKAEEDVTGKNKQISELRTQLAELKSSSGNRAPTVAPTAAPAPVVAAAPVAAADDSSDLPWPLLLGAVLILLLLLGLAYSVRRNRIKNQLALIPEPVEPIVKPAQSAVTPVFEVPDVAPKPAASTSSTSTTSSGQRLAGASTDALDGASIYIAYGRFTEALAILREALQKQPQRTDLRLRILELLGEQGDLVGFDEEEKVLLNQGIEPHRLQEIRSRYPKLKLAAQPAPVAPAPVASVVAPAVVAAAAAVTLAAVTPPARSDAQLDENAAAALNPKTEDDFQLNLDDLSMDSDWDLVDPFESTPAPRKPVPKGPEPVDPAFASDLRQLPEVFEMPDEQFLSDFAEPEPEPQAIAEHELDLDLDLDLDIDMDADLGLDLKPEPLVETTVQTNSDALDDAFLDGFMDDESEFDLLDMEEEPLSKINQAQVLIDEGSIEEARQLLEEVIAGSDDGPQQTARDLLAGIS